MVKKQGPGAGDQGSGRDSEKGKYWGREPGARDQKKEDSKKK
jgi:hypothetical protein